MLTVRLACSARKGLVRYPASAWAGIVLISQTTACLLQQTTITTDGNRAREGTRRASSGVESGEVQIVKTALRGVHRRLRHDWLSLVFLVFLPASH